ncbi:hypothetical protein [Actinoplanes xinjiangensis]|nr:hypothetical protein [Actinoplanes xinjiangensis]GIF39365.1 hypothetical protein Axi01nite_36760 [Actinoplanes xinjiangensis]
MTGRPKINKIAEQRRQTLNPKLSSQTPAASHQPANAIHHPQPVPTGAAAASVLVVEALTPISAHSRRTCAPIGAITTAEAHDSPIVCADPCHDGDQHTQTAIVCARHRYPPRRRQPAPNRVRWSPLPVALPATDRRNVGARHRYPACRRRQTAEPNTNQPPTEHGGSHRTQRTPPLASTNHRQQAAPTTATTGMAAPEPTPTTLKDRPDGQESPVHATVDLPGWFSPLPQTR